MIETDLLSDNINFLSTSEAIQHILRVLCHTTGLRISLVARVTENSWTCCAALDEAGFGLKPGDQLEVNTTFCNVVRTTNAPVLINRAKIHPIFSDHIAISMYNVENYIAVPVNLRDGRCFGALCALDIVPFEANLDENNLIIFNLLSQLVAYELEAQAERESKEAEISGLNDIITIAAHDLRQPLTAIQLRAHLASRQAKRENVSPELGKMLDNLVTDVRKATHLTDILLDVGRIEAGNFILETGEVDLARLITQAVEEQQAAAPDAEFETEIPAQLLIEGDETRLGQVVRNLLDNAIKYSPGPKKAVEVRLSSLPGDTIFLQIRDFGMGVEEADLPNLFRRQFRTPQAQAEGIKGSGYGLYITQKIVEAHRGHIWADQPTGGGLRFNITLPIANPIPD